MVWTRPGPNWPSTGARVLSSTRFCADHCSGLRQRHQATVANNGQGRRTAQTTKFGPALMVCTSHLAITCDALFSHSTESTNTRPLKAHHQKYRCLWIGLFQLVESSVTFGQLCPGTMCRISATLTTTF